MTEVWRDVEGTGYKVSSLGRVIGKRGTILSPTLMNNGYYRIAINGKGKYVHRLVAEAFLGKAPGMQVDHIDGNKANNNVRNLRWVTPKENMEYAYVLGRRTNQTSRRGIPVVMTTEDTRQEFPSMSAAARAVNKTQAWIWQAVCLGYECRGVRWSRAE